MESLNYCFMPIPSFAAFLHFKALLGMPATKSICKRSCLYLIKYTALLHMMQNLWALTAAGTQAVSLDNFSLWAGCGLIRALV